MLNPAEVQAMIPSLTGTALLDVGGQKVVYRGKHAVYEDVVIKFFLDTSSDERIRREIEVSTTYNIPNVPKLYEWRQISDHNGKEVIYLIEEFIAGETLAKLLHRDGSLSLPQGLLLLETLLTTVVSLEENALVHRDIKPLNIIVKTDGQFCLLDFGIARHLRKSSITRTQAPFGPHSVGYSAPEQFRNIKREVDSRADLFSIGVVTYEALTGVNPFDDGKCGALEVLRRTETITPQLVTIPGDTQRQLIGLLDIMMRKFPSQRPPNAKTALDWFRALLPTLNY